MNSFRIVKCSDPLLWYSQKIGELFICHRTERLTGGDILWTYEKTKIGNFLNWVWASDAEEVKQE